jgi:hypothetical protein
VNGEQGLEMVREREPVEPGEIDVDVDLDTQAEAGARSGNGNNNDNGMDVDVDMDNDLRLGARTNNEDERDDLSATTAVTSRTREYKVVGVVRKKVVFALR